MSESKICEQCGEPFARPPGRTEQWKRRRYCGRRCYALSRTKERPLCACGCGQRVKTNGSRYALNHGRITGKPFLSHGRWHITGRDGRVYEWSRVVMAGVLGRDLAPDEHVHHVNEDKADDRPENLEVLTPPEHQRRHLKVRGVIG
jgi:hypothetical protein